jgi:hypothetical protein
MKPIQTVAVCTIVFLVVSLGIGTVCAQTKVFTHENGVLAQAFAGDRAVFFGDTTLTMETEPEGGWLPNKTYQVNWTLSLESVTPGFLNDTAFYILVSWPPLENITLAIPAETILNQTQLNLEHKTGTISAAFTPTNASDGFYMNPDFPFTVYINNEPSTEVWASGMWHGGGGISTNIIGNDTTPHSPLLTSTATEFPTLTVAIAAATLLVALPLVIVKKRSSRR